MRYISTRRPVGDESSVTFEEAVLTGLAPDGGLYVPEVIPSLSLAKILSWADLPFYELAYEIFKHFFDETEIPPTDMKAILKKSFSTFSHPDVTPLIKLPIVQEGGNAENLWVLELFHGPTFAFKDVALQVLGNLFEYFLDRKRSTLRVEDKDEVGLTILGATSGDTGGAAIYGLRGKKGIDAFILHPKGRVSPIQELQMTTVLDANVHNVAIEGTFDDCQEIVKILFSDAEFKKTYQLGAVNSINWARILSQTTYYFHSFFEVLRALKVPFKDAPSYAALTKIQYSVPTGNFGDVLAGFYAKRMGLPIHNLIIATNENDILHRFLQTGAYEKRQDSHSNNPLSDQSSHNEDVKMTLSPAMDILISSNFERLLFHLLAEEHKMQSTASEEISQYMKDLKTKGGFKVPFAILEAARSQFSSSRIPDSQTRDTISRYYHVPPTSYNPNDHYVLDPHTAVGVAAAENVLEFQSGVIQTIVLGTASPGKFPDAVLSSINEPITDMKLNQGFQPLKVDQFSPKALVELEGLPKRCIDVKTGGSLDVGVTQVRRVIAGVLSGKKVPQGRL